MKKKKENKAFFLLCGKRSMGWVFFFFPLNLEISQSKQVLLTGK